MQPNYLERVAETRKNTGQRAAQEQDLGAMLAELKKMQLAALMGNQPKETVIVTDHTELANRLTAAITAIGKEVSRLNSAASDAEQLAALKKMQGIFDGYFKRAGSDTSSIVAAIKGLNIAPVVQAPIIRPVVNLPEPKVNVTTAPVDFAPLQQTIREAMAQPTASEPASYPPDRCDLSRYRAQDLSDSGDTQYVGYVNPEGNWYIIENDVRANRMRYVFGLSGYARHFRQAATYQYKLLDKAYHVAA